MIILYTYVHICVHRSERTSGLRHMNVCRHSWRKRTYNVPTQACTCFLKGFYKK